MCPYLLNRTQKSTIEYFVVTTSFCCKHTYVSYSFQSTYFKFIADVSGNKEIKLAQATGSENRFLNMPPGKIFGHQPVYINKGINMENILTI